MVEEEKGTEAKMAHESKLNWIPIREWCSMHRDMDIVCGLLEMKMMQCEAKKMEARASYRKEKKRMRHSCGTENKERSFRRPIQRIGNTTCRCWDKPQI